MADERILICGYATIFMAHCDVAMKHQLAQVGHSPSGLYGAIFVLDPVSDGRRKKWTMFTADADYAAMLATGTDTPLAISPALAKEKFPAYVPGWVIDDVTDVHV